MHVVICTPYFAPAWGYGGPARLLYELSLNLAKVGTDVTILTSDASDSNARYSARETRDDGIRVVREPSLSQWLAYKQKKFIVPSYPSRLAALLEASDVAHLIGSRDFFVTMGAAVARRVRKPYVLAAYGCLPVSKEGWKRLGHPVYDALFTNRTVRNAGVCLAQTHHEREVYRTFGVRDERIRLTPLAADGRRFLNLPERGSFRRQLNLGSRQRIVLFVGRVHPLKGLDTLVSSFRLMHDEEPEARLVVVGKDDGYLQRLRTQVYELGLANEVIFPGPLYKEDVLRAYVDADVFALTPSHFEETTLAGLEACFCGTQAVVTRQADIPYLEDHGAGAVVRDDPEEIASALLEAISSDEIIAVRGRAARAMAYSRFDWKVLVPHYLEAYQQAVSNPNVPYNRPRAS